ncbi:hypothetical protein ACFLVF_01430 [Chloroflexota bacterium]
MKYSQVPKILLFLLASVVLWFGFTGCGGPVHEIENPTNGHPTEAMPSVSGEATGTTIGYTYHRPDGNRLVAGRSALPDAAFIDLRLKGVPRWIVGAATGGSSLWVAVLDDGQVEGFRLESGQIQSIPVIPEQIPAGMPPLLKVTNGQAMLVVPAKPNASEVTHPILLPSSGDLVFVDSDGDIVFWDGAETGRLRLKALPDARLLVDERERILVLADATTRYAHGVLGDKVEAGSVTLIETKPSPRVLVTIPMPGDSVVEGIAPIWVDMTGDGLWEIVVTVSNAREGAVIVVFDEAGRQIAAGPSIGQGSRWRHQMAVAPFGPNGENELADVLTPHLGGVVEFYQLYGNKLKVVAEVRGYTSHIIGSRNLDMAVAGDFDGDGQLELLLPNQGRTGLGGIRRTEAGVKVAWTLPIGGRISTNIAAVTLNNGKLTIAVGREDGVMRVWLP